MSKTVAVDGLGAEIARQLAEYSADVAEDVKKAVIDEGKQCVKDIRENITASGIQQHTGEYRKAWNSKKTSETPSGVTVIVNAGKQYRLTHLLEKGHAKVGKGGGRTRSFPHIKPAEDAAAERLGKKVKLIVKGGA